MIILNPHSKSIWCKQCGLLGAIAVVMTVFTDPKISEAIKVRYKSDSFCQKVLGNLDSFPAAKMVNGLIFIGSRLVVL
jgi:hypothetical protein